MYVFDQLLFASGGRSNYRIPSIVVTNDGTVLAFCNDRKDSVIDHAEEVAVVCGHRLPDGTWTDVQTLAGVPGWSCMIGSAVYDADTDTIFCSSGRNPIARNEFGKYTAEELAAMEKEAEERARALGIRRGLFFVVSTDGGETWTERPFAIEERPFVRPYDGAEVMLGGSCHGSAHGIQLRHGDHAGRLLCPSRVSVGHYDTWEGLRTCSYNNSVYSDDHGMTWKASAPVQAATGEGTLIERGDGSILYNSRAYFGDQKRYLALSTDGGETYGDFRADDFLIEEKSLGCNASFLRVEREDLPAEAQALLPEEADSVTVFVNPRSDKRNTLTACVSFDSGETWAKTKLIWEKACAYSSLDYSKADGHFYLLYERGDENPYGDGIAVREFDLEWLLAE
jgi:sialidase-1